MRRQIDPALIKALALDLDGTTLLPGAVLGERTAACLKTLQAKGIQIIFCTGRAIEAAEKYFAPSGAEGPMVFFNGAEIADVPGGNVLSSNLLDLDVVDFGIDLARNMGLHYQIYLPPGLLSEAGRREALLIDRPGPEAEMYRKHTGITPIIKDLKTAIAMPNLPGCIKAMFISEPSFHEEIRQKMSERFGSRIYMARTTPVFMEIMNAGVSKGAGLKTVLQYRGLRAEEVIAFGDEESDIPMFNAAGFSAAPSNAKEKVLEAADAVFGSNSEEGLAAYLEELFGL
ncbi:MAG: Cof-type HAD-IIB family hydrolase [Treponema sp.]|jgi:Cof subfamily protein (haloacid dehalogenase superfamily)|nr:Cof-type HAD-IIB family hydrolase [Treponema sp.]